MGLEVEPQILRDETTDAATEARITKLQREIQTLRDEIEAIWKYVATVMTQ